MRSATPLKVHITGVYGLIGNLAYEHLAAQPHKYDVYGSGRRTMSSARADAESITRLPDDHFMIADLADAAAMEKAITGMDAVLHIAAVPDPGASFEDVLSSNIVGTHNVLEACRKLGVKRLVYASSIMATWVGRGLLPYLS
ncbi:MAG: NAD-dependent epimerase/dehydratase family protein [Caldilinea sp. CFX5]|nr:NAD-dependent epimerase/dehydratase family protein [Caldilinea sp. CFX5]